MSQLRIHRADRRFTLVRFYRRSLANRGNRICRSCRLVSFFSETDHSLVLHPALRTLLYRLAIVLADRSTWRVASRFDLYESLRKRISPRAGMWMYGSANSRAYVYVCSRWTVFNCALARVQPRYHGSNHRWLW